MIQNWRFCRDDEEAAAELSGFLPEKLFDIHAHLYRVADLHLGRGQQGYLTEGPEEAGLIAWRQSLEKQGGGNRLSGGLFFAFPTDDCDVDSANNYVVDQLNTVKDSRGLLLVTPQTQEGTILEALENPLIVGLKPYHIYSTERPTFESSVFGYMPERLWALAGQRELIVMLHLVRAAALSDAENLAAIRSMCEKYPGVKLILAHAGRGFCAHNTVRSIARLCGLENIWFDTSGICEAAALRAILEKFGPHRLLWGSDFPLSQMRGRCVTVGDGFAWLNNTTVLWENVALHCAPILVGLESIRAVKEACDLQGLSRDDIWELFYGNALRLTRAEPYNGVISDRVKGLTV